MQTADSRANSAMLRLRPEPVGEVAAGEVAEEGARDQERQVAAGADDGQVRASVLRYVGTQVASV